MILRLSFTFNPCFTEVACFHVFQEACLEMLDEKVNLRTRE